MTDKRLAILGFHKIGPPPVDGWETWYYISQATFVDQLSALRDGGWEVITLEAVLEGLDEPDTLPERAALLTFDDGYASMVTETLPVLQRFGYPAVLFVPTDFIGGTNGWDVDNEPNEKICDWDELRCLEAAGVSVQSHSASHPWFSELTPAQLDKELRRSKAVLEEGLEKSVQTIAFPYGDAGPVGVPDRHGVQQALEETGYRAAFLYGGGPVHFPAADRYGLSRLAMGSDTDLWSALEHTDSR